MDLFTQSIVNVLTILALELALWQLVRLTIMVHVLSNIGSQISHSEKLIVEFGLN